MNTLDESWDKIRWDISDSREKTEDIWQLFHENSKTNKYDYPLSNEKILERMGELSVSLSYDRYPKIVLPKQLFTLDLSLEHALNQRKTTLDMAPASLSLTQIATILHYCYGVNRNNTNTQFTRPFRMVPSAGALYPLDIYFHSSSINEISPGFYHYNPVENQLSFLKEGDYTEEISKRMVFGEIAKKSSLIIFITGLFERSVFKYKDRGYRFVLIESGHVGQNIDLICAAMNLGVMNIGGYFDREIDEFLELDGVNQSTVYMAAIGKLA